MSENQEKKVHGIVAEYESVDSLLDACRRVRDAGYKKTDAYTPFPVHGIDKALGIKPTHLPWIVLVCGLTGTATALLMQIWMNAIDYPYIISGKPFISLPAFIPVAFELMAHPSKRSRFHWPTRCQARHFPTSRATTRCCRYRPWRRLNRVFLRKACHCRRRR